MKIIIKTKNIELNSLLQEYIEEKINSLERFIKSFQAKLSYDVFFGKGRPKIEAWVEIEKTTQHHRRGPIFRIECQMRFPKKSIRSEVVGEDLKLIITELKDELQRELKEYKQKYNNQSKKESRRIKKDLKISLMARFWRRGRIREEGI